MTSAWWPVLSTLYHCQQSFLFVVDYIRKRQGFLGLYRGTTARVCGNVIQTYVSKNIPKLFPFKNEHESEEENEGDTPADISEEDKVLRFFQKTVREMLAQCAAVVASQPFQVITVRMVAQFVGGEDKYSNLFSSIKEIYKQDGLGGFFSGLVPRLLGELFSLWLYTCLTFVINTYLIKDKDLQVYTGASMSFISVAVTYPFILVSKVMCVNNSGLAAGMPPHMPIYTSWTDCWSHLKTQNQLKRGSSLLWRYYTGPCILKNGQPVVASETNFRAPVSTKYN